MIDRYTKAVLTVIAAALCALVAQNAIGPSQAETGRLQRVVICNAENSNCVGVSGKGGKYETSTDGSLFTSAKAP